MDMDAQSTNKTLLFVVKKSHNTQAVLSSFNWHPRMCIHRASKNRVWDTFCELTTRHTPSKPVVPQTLYFSNCPLQGGQSTSRGAILLQSKVSGADNLFWSVLEMDYCHLDTLLRGTSYFVTGPISWRLLNFMTTMGKCKCVAALECIQVWFQLVLNLDSQRSEASICTCSSIHSMVRSSICSSVRSSIGSLLRSLVRSSIHSIHAE